MKIEEIYKVILKEDQYLTISTKNIFQAKFSHTIPLVRIILEEILQPLFIWRSFGLLFFW